MVLTLLTLCVGALSLDAPPAPNGTPGGAAVVQSDARMPSALPAPTWTVAIDAGGRPPPRVTRRTGDIPPPQPSLAAHAPAPGSYADGPRLRSGAFLLGLRAAPANAPPRS